MGFDELRICTFNCCSLRKNIELIRELSSDGYDIIFLQETFLIEEKIGELDFIDDNYECIGVPAIYSARVLTAGAGRPEGGMAILWKKDSKFKINRVMLENNFMALNVEMKGIKVLLVNVYLNSDIWEVSTLEKYLLSLSLFDNLMEEMIFDSVHFVEDFNGDPISGRAWRNLGEFMQRNNFECFDVNALPPDTCTFIGYGNSQGRWLDHIVGRVHESVSVKNINVLQDLIGSDHLPLEFVLQFESDFITTVIQEKCDLKKDFIAWDKLKAEDFEKINTIVDNQLASVGDLSSHDCSVIGCNNKDHLREMDELYIKLINAIQIGAEEFKRSVVKENSFKVIPGWNRRVKSLYLEARNKYLDWRGDGRSLGTAKHENMIKSRREFKKALNHCKANEHQEKCKSIVEKFSTKNFREFWKEVRKQKTRLKNSNIIEGLNDNNLIVNKFADKYLSTTGDSSETENDFIKLLKDKWLSSKKMYVKISVPTLRKLIASLSCGVGHDGIHSLFLKNSSDLFLARLCMLLNAWYSHCFLSLEVLKGTISPTIKDTKGNITEMSNYRPVMQSSCILKIVEMHILQILSEKIIFSHMQFGFRRGVSTTDACFLLKEVMHKYSKGKQCGYATFIDMSKAFDRVDHFKLGFKLLSKNIPIDIVYLLMHYLRNQQANVVWKGTSSNFSFLEEGVRQGGILSPFLFKFYIDDLIRDITAMEEGCMLGISRINIVVYADDIVLITSSLDEMGRLYTKLCLDIRDLKLQVNKDKTKCMCFGYVKKGDLSDKVKLGADELEIVKSYKYLGHIVEHDLSDISDIVYRLNKFYGCTNSVLRNFKHTDEKTLLFLFNSYCKPVYGLNLWTNKLSMSRCKLKAFEVAYNNTLKRIIGVPLYSSNHEVAEKCDVLLLRHHIAQLQATYYHRIYDSCCFLIKFNLPFLKCGYYFTHVNKIFIDVYGIDVSRWPNDVINSRISWVQKHEPRRVPYRPNDS